MGLLVDGQWTDQWYNTSSSNGKFVRSESQFRHWVTADGMEGPSGEGDFKAEVGRYHLYVSHACPWANRTLAVRALKGLAPMITVDVVNPLMLDKGWTFSTDYPGATGDRLYNKQYLYEIYTQVDKEITTRVTVPILWDKKRQTIVSNESSEIIRMFNVAFDHLTGSTLDLYPIEYQSEINEFNDRIYHHINNGVYRAGFATTQDAYDEAVHKLFEALDWLERHLHQKKYLVGDSVTEADIRLAMTLFRFDLVYVQHFKTDKYRLVDYPNLWRFTRGIYQHKGIDQTVNFDHIREHYFRSHPTINPYAITPVGPQIDWWAPL